MAGMIRKLIASGVAAKVIQEARKPREPGEDQEDDRGLPEQRTAVAPAAPY